MTIAPAISFQDKVDDFLTPKQVLFLSADLVGSTAMKQRREVVDGKNVPDNELWARVIQALYVKASDGFSDRWEARKKSLSADSAEAMLGTLPVLWKTIGDEVIFRKYISSAHQVLETILIWIDMIGDVKTHLQDLSNNPELEIKCTAWIAEFPIQNRVLVGAGLKHTEGASDEAIRAERKTRIEQALFGFESKQAGAGIGIDFVGPAIDIGFRLAKHATARKFILSMDTAYLLTIAAIDARNVVSLRYDGPIKLAGVFGGIGYPIFWIDMADLRSSERLQDKLAGTDELNPQDVEAYCEAFYSETSNFTDRPFILSESHASPKRKATLVERPGWYDVAIEKARIAYNMTDETPATH